MMPKKSYTQEFKREAVRLAQTSGKPIAQIARELGISDANVVPKMEILHIRMHEMKVH
jgi:transposase-like protein